VCEDKGEQDPINHLKGITPEGLVYTIARNAHPARGELAGACFSPDGATMFLNIYSPGMTLAIQGPWQSLNRARAA
jgi:secreted PhoX family phosphatase